jgi:hypothetical protein
MLRHKIESKIQKNSKKEIQNRKTTKKERNKTPKKYQKQSATERRT